MHIRPETEDDYNTIRSLTKTAFENMPFSDQTEHRIIDALRADGALTLSLVATTEDDHIIAHVAFSPVTINSAFIDWYGLGPVSVWPENQQQGWGQAVIREGLKQLQKLGAKGCVLLGDPRYYQRFGFEHDPELRYGDMSRPYFQRLAFGDSIPKGSVAFHPAFEEV